MLEEPLTGPGGQGMGTHRQIIRIYDSVHKWGDVDVLRRSLTPLENRGVLCTLYTW